VALSYAVIRPSAAIRIIATRGPNGAADHPMTREFQAAAV
jgi:hypothetical protein